MLNLLWNKPKAERFSLDNLKDLCKKFKDLSKNGNEDSIVTCLKELTQILIWGDQHDPRLFEYFFEERVQWRFLRILEKNQSGSLIVQILQTLNIMFENVRSRVSLYFLLSNNYVNELISARYDFLNDEILAYYIYLLRTLSFKLSKDTIYFFYNEHTKGFPLYFKAVTFYNHEESMIRIAVRVITLNVYSVNDPQMRDFIMDTTKVYFSNLVSFIGDYGSKINDKLLSSEEGESSRINYFLAEHLDCFFYVNDIVELDIPKFNKELVAILLSRLLKPVYMNSLLPPDSIGAIQNSSNLRLMPIVALSLLLHAFQVLRHAPLVSALASALFSNQLYLTRQTTQQQIRAAPLTLLLGAQSVSPESSRPASPVTSKFHSFGLLGSSPSGLDSVNWPSDANATRSRAHHHQPQPTRLDSTISVQSNSTTSSTQPPQLQSNPFKATVFEYLSQTDNDRLVAPALMLIYLVGRNQGVMSDVLLATDICPQRLLRSRMIVGDLTGLSPSRPSLGTSPMSRDCSGESIQSANNQRSPGPQRNGNIFGASGSVAATRLRPKTADSPLFKDEEDEKKPRETEEFLTADADMAPSNRGRFVSPFKPGSLPKGQPGGMGASSQLLSGSYPSNMKPIYSTSATQDSAVDQFEYEVSKPKARSSNSRPRRGSKASSLLGPSLPTTHEESKSSIDKPDVPKNLEVELKPVIFSKKGHGQSRVESLYERPDFYSSEDEDTEFEDNASSGLESEGQPPPLPHNREVRNDDTHSILESVETHSEPLIQSREDLIERLMAILCGQPDSGAHRFRIITIQMAAELLLELVHTKGATGREALGLSSKSSSVNSSPANHPPQEPDMTQIGEARLHRLALAETVFRGRVRSGIQELEKRKRGTSDLEGDHNRAPCGILTGKVQKAITESNLGIDKQLGNLISESSVVYAQGKTLENTLDLELDAELVALFDLDPGYIGVTTAFGGFKVEDKAQRDTKETTSNSATDAPWVQRVWSLNKYDSRIQSSVPPHDPKVDRAKADLRLEAMVLRYVKWLHILVQCRQMLHPRAGVTTSDSILAIKTAAVGSSANFAKSATFTPPTPTMESPLISLTKDSIVAPTPIQLQRRPSDLVGSMKSLSTSPGGSVTSTNPTSQKALATTAITGSNSTTLTRDTSISPLEEGDDSSSDSLSPKVLVSGGAPARTTSPSPRLSVYNATSQPAVGTGTVTAVSATGVGGTTGGGNRKLSATAALEAAVNSIESQQHQHQHPGHLNLFNPAHASALLATHLVDPLSAGVQGAIKGGATIIKTMIDPLAATNMLFRSTSPPIANSGSLENQSSPSTRGFYQPPSHVGVQPNGPSVVSSTAPSMASLTGLQHNGALYGQESETSDRVTAVSMQRSTSTTSEGSIRSDTTASDMMTGLW